MIQINPFGELKIVLTAGYTNKIKNSKLKTPLINPGA
jgi:hypothetical protein